MDPSSTKQHAQNWRSLLSAPFFIALIAFLVRMAVLAIDIASRSGPHPIFSGFETVQIATSLATGKGFSSPLGVASGPTAWLTPIFPLLLAGVFKVCGVGTLAAEIAIKILESAFSALVCVVLVALGRRSSLPSSGILSAWAWAFLPAAITYSVYWIWDTSLSALCLVVLLWMSYTLADSKSWTAWAAYAAVWAFAALTNPALLSALPGLSGFAIYQSRKLGRVSVRKLLLAAVVFLGCVSPWIIRNEIVFHGKVAFRSNFGLELWLGNNNQVADLWAPWLHPANDPQERKKLLQLGEVAYMNEKTRLALDFMTTHPAEVLQHSYLRFMTTWTGGENYLNDLQTTLPLRFRVEMLFNCAFALLAFAGLLRLSRARDSLVFPVAWILLVYPLVYYVTHPNPRYRSPIDPCLSFLAAYAVTEAFHWFRARNPQPLRSPESQQERSLPA